MDLLKAFRYRLDPSPKQLDKIRSWGGTKRYVWNRLLSERTEAWKNLGKEPSKEERKAFSRSWSYKAMSKMVTHWRAELEWLREAPYHATQNTAKQLQGAYQKWWDGLAGHPKYKKKRDESDSWCETDKVLLGINGQAVKLPKLGWVKARISRPFQGTIRQATVKQEGDNWYVSILSLVNVEVPENKNSPVGIDLGIAHAATDSDGMHHELPVETKEEVRKLKLLAKEVSRKKKGSRNRSKAQKRLNKAKRRIRRRVLNAAHNLTAAMTKNHGLVAVEDLAIKNMTASAAGTKKAPGKNVAAKRGLNRKILARGWGEIRRQLEYKCAWYGSKFVLVPPAYSSQECSECGHMSPENRKTQDRFRCVSCGHAENADVNAAKVILKRGLKLVAAGHAVTACGEDVRPCVGRQTSVKQEPTRGAQQCAV